MRPFDDISSPELGLEDDVLPTQQRFPTPRWLQQRHGEGRAAASAFHPSPSSSWKSTLSRRLGSAPAAARSLCRLAGDAALLPLLTNALTVLAAHAPSSSMPAVLRPRLTPRYVLSALLLLYATYRCLLTSRPLLASDLPPYAGGPYGVAALDIEVPLAGGPRRVSNATFAADGRPAFDVHTVLFTLYYPTTSSSSGRTDAVAAEPADRYHWIPKPVSATARGYARFLGADNALVRGALTFGLWLVAGGITIPARVGAPLVPVDEQLVVDDGNLFDDVDAAVEGRRRLPVMVFSHGMLSSRTDYTAYLGALAARGVVVAALEHRDGSSPGSAVMTTTAAATEWRYGFGLRDLAPAQGGGKLDTPALKEAQLSFREAEIDAALSVLRALDAGPSSSSSSSSSSPSIQQPPTAATNPRHPASVPSDIYTTFVNRLDVARPTLAGHSYGATGVLRALRQRSHSSSAATTTSPRHGETPPPSPWFAGAVALDPGKSSGPLNADVTVPLAICHSASWSRPGAGLFFGRPHFDVVRDIAEGLNERCSGSGGGDSNTLSPSPLHPSPPSSLLRRAEEQTNANDNNNNNCTAGARGWFFTSLGTSHPSITDAPLLEPLLLSWTTGSTMDAAQGIRQYVHLTRDFVSYQHTGARGGLLALSGDESAVSRDYDPAHNDGMPERWRKYWQVHVAPAD